MFTQKKTFLFAEVKQTKPNAFLNAGKKASAETLSGNGALKYSSSGDAFVDQFTFIGNYKKPRPTSEIFADCEILWAESKKLAVLFIFYLRMITRVTNLFSGVSTKMSQKGAEMRHEGIMRAVWLSIKEPKIFWKNIGLFVAVGSWKDIIMMLQYDLIYNGWDNRALDWKKFGDFLMSGLKNERACELIKKYLPQIQARSKCTTVESQADTMIGKWLCSILFPGDTKSYVKYRKLKSSGTAHQWQKLISQRKFNEIDFSSIHGRALHLLVKGKFLTNHNLKEKYEEWITKPETKDVKYTGFVHELFESIAKYSALVNVPKALEETINKQFITLIEKGGKSEQSNLIVVRDTSASMGSIANGTNMSAGDIAKALALYFSYFLKGAFKNSWIEFHSDAAIREWKGSTPMEKWFNDKSSYVGSTDFQSVINLLCRIKYSGVSEEEFPTGILCISDGEFNSTHTRSTNVGAAKEKLIRAGFSKEYVNNFVIVLWNLQSYAYGRNTGKKFETFGTDVPNVFYFSGYSASVISFLTSKIRTPRELFEEAMNQEILQMIEI